MRRGTALVIAVMVSVAVGFTATVKIHDWAGIPAAVVGFGAAILLCKPLIRFPSTPSEAEG